MNVELLCVTFGRDRLWAEYLCRSIQKFASGFSALKLVVPWPNHASFVELERYSRPDLPILTRSYHEMPDRGMIHHEAQIVCADIWCQAADLICHVDADCLFTKPVTPGIYMANGKPVLLHQPYETIVFPNGNPHPAQQWQATVKRAIDIPAPSETMRRHPALHHRDLYRQVRERVEQIHQCPFVDYVLSCQSTWPQQFAEFPTLGAWAMHAMPERYELIDVSKNPYPDNPLIQGWSQHKPGDPRHDDHKRQQIDKWNGLLQ